MTFLDKKAEVAEILMNAIEKTAQDTDFHTPDSLAALASAYALVSEHGKNKRDPDAKRAGAMII